MGATPFASPTPSGRFKPVLFLVLRVWGSLFFQEGSPGHLHTKGGCCRCAGNVRVKQNSGVQP